MTLRRTFVTAALGLGLIAVPAQASKIVDTSPALGKLRGKPVAVFFFHPL